jgi:hypothetical protein
MCQYAVSNEFDSKFHVMGIQKNVRTCTCTHIINFNIKTVRSVVIVVGARSNLPLRK